MMLVMNILEPSGKVWKKFKRTDLTLIPVKFKDGNMKVLEGVLAFKFGFSLTLQSKH